MDLRKLHNANKRDFINNVVKEGQTILDAGCGCGGDLMKWGHNKVVVYACDPDPASITEARKRSKTLKQKVHFFNGDISKTPIQEYDIICYNFSIHYIFATEELFMKTIKCISERTKIGTKIIGVVPDSDEILMAPTFTRDHLGNEFIKGNLNGEFGDLVKFNIAGSPYYKNGPVTEPVCYKDLLITYLEREGFELETWTPFISFPTGCISDMYSKFIFCRIR